MSPHTNKPSPNEPLEDDMEALTDRLEQAACFAADLNVEFAEDIGELERHGLLSEVSRRRFIQASSAIAASLAFGMPALTEAQETMHMASVTLKVNGKPETLSLDPRTSLLDALREHMDMTGTKKGCDHGQCGACTVLVDGRRVNSCLTLAFAAEGTEITTIEGLGKTSDPKVIEDLHPVQAAFLIHDGYQCGYCTPGQIISATAAITEQQKGELSIISWHNGGSDRPELTDDEIRERMSGNICRCGAYPNIVAAVRAASKGASA
ncbi:MAG TPA: 2Fe-2S iron-sulfur cluster-binding protein [Edaphobacter sp.]|nr:2Fe-2S iron-sulfur cluster-binding protein [Edaphobacter sp.]